MIYELMSAIAEQTPLAEEKPKIFRFNSENARAMSLRAWELRRKRAAEQAANPQPVQTASPNVQLFPVYREPLSDEAKEELELVIEQITRTVNVLNDDDYCFCEHCKRAGIEPHHRAQLLRALDALLERKRILRRDPMPGSLRPAASKQRQPRAGNSMPEPIPIGE